MTEAIKITLATLVFALIILTTVTGAVIHEMVVNRRNLEDSLIARREDLLAQQDNLQTLSKQLNLSLEQEIKDYEVLKEMNAKDSTTPIKVDLPPAPKPTPRPTPTPRPVVTRAS